MGKSRTRPKPKHPLYQKVVEHAYGFTGPRCGPDTKRAPWYQARTAWLAVAVFLHDCATVKSARRMILKEVPDSDLRCLMCRVMAEIEELE